MEEDSSSDELGEEEEEPLPEQVEEQAREEHGDKVVDSLILADNVADWVDMVLDDTALWDPKELGALAVMSLKTAPKQNDYQSEVLFATLVDLYRWMPRMGHLRAELRVAKYNVGRGLAGGGPSSHTSKWANLSPQFAPAMHVPSTVSLEGAAGLFSFPRLLYLILFFGAFYESVPIAIRAAFSHTGTSSIHGVLTFIRCPVELALLFLHSYQPSCAHTPISIVTSKKAPARTSTIFCCTADLFHAAYLLCRLLPPRPRR
ncbi:hypothetical protein K438DRAFT_2010133 [Mycena galopus ATCC 62051]|nr:hypothetical protein K438DRAFT_2010133 [Mycena galopus ATCC 62051]